MGKTGWNTESGPALNCPRRRCPGARGSPRNDRSAYRIHHCPLVEPVTGFCSIEKHEMFVSDVVMLEGALVREDIKIVKCRFSINREERHKRLDRRHRQ